MQIKGISFNRVKLDSDGDAAETGNDVFRGRIEEIVGELEEEKEVVPVPIGPWAPDILAKLASNPVIFPTRTSEKFPLENSTAVALTTSVMSPSRITVPLLSSSRSGGRWKGWVAAAHCLTSPWCDDATFHGQVWSAAPGNGGWR